MGKIYIFQVFLHNRNNIGIPVKGLSFLKLQVSNLKNEFLDRYFSRKFIRIKLNEIKLKLKINSFSVDIFDEYLYRDS